MSTESFSGGSDPDTEDRTLPPYEGRRETADVGDQSNSEKAGCQDSGRHWACSRRGDESPGSGGHRTRSAGLTCR
jgi:hypothetical protein